MSEHYDFHYQPTGSGAISGQQVLQQTEDAINELGDYVNDNVGGAMDVAQQALETAQNAEQDAQTALDTANSFSDAIQSAQQDASTALSTAQTAQTTASNANNTAIQAQQDASSAVTTANNASGQVTTLSGTVTTLGQRVTTAEGNIGQNTSDITALGQRVTTAEGNITTLQNDVTIAQGNASSAMATAGQVKQQAFVFRYSSTALVASSTNSNTLLDNTDNLKVGDKVIDSSGVLFSVTAIDTQNSTFTIGTALIDLAQDSDVVHKSGDETVGGVKTFSDGTYIKSLNFTNEVPSQSSSSNSIMPIITTITYGDSSPSVQARLNLRVTADGIKSLYPHENNQYALGLTSRKWSEVHGVTYYYGSSDTEFSDKFVTTDTAQTISGVKTFSDNISTKKIISNVAQLQINARSSADSVAVIAGANASEGSGIWLYGKDNATGSDCRIQIYNTTKSRYERVDLIDSQFLPAPSGELDCGSTSNKWKTFNGLNPSSLSLPDLSNGIDISSYITHLDKVVNTYTPLANGWLSIRVKKTSLTHTSVMVYQTGGLLSSCETTEFSISGTNLPVIANKNVEIYIYADSLASAIFYPCQGNV